MTRYRIVSQTPVTVSQTNGTKCILYMTTHASDTGAGSGSINTTGQGSKRPVLLGFGIYSGKPASGTVYKVAVQLRYITSAPAGTDVTPVPLDPRWSGTRRAGGVEGATSPTTGTILKTLHIAGDGGYEYIAPPGLEDILDADVSGKERVGLFVTVTADAGATAADFYAYFIYEE